MSDYQRTYRQAHPEKQEQIRAWRHANPERARLNSITSRYGITFEWYQAKLAEQDGRCAICREPLAPKGYWTHVDHDHTTDQARALLCGHCNRGLGGFRDSPRLLIAAIRYLDAHGIPEDAPLTIVAI